MLHFAGMTDEERVARLERKATEIRKMLFGALLLAKDAWKDDLLRGGEGIEIMKTMEKAEESFTYTRRYNGDQAIPIKKYALIAP